MKENPNAHAQASQSWAFGATLGFEYTNSGSLILLHWGRGFWAMIVSWERNIYASVEMRFKGFPAVRQQDYGWHADNYLYV